MCQIYSRLYHYLKLLLLAFVGPQKMAHAQILWEKLSTHTLLLLPCFFTNYPTTTDEF